MFGVAVSEENTVICVGMQAHQQGVECCTRSDGAGRMRISLSESALNLPIETKSIDTLTTLRRVCDILEGVEVLIKPSGIRVSKQVQGTAAICLNLTSS